MRLTERGRLRAGVRLAVVVLIGLALMPPRALADMVGRDSPTGLWLTQDHGGVIAIGPCGPALCGRIVGVTLDHPTDPPPVDNQGHPQCGLTIITGLQRADGNLWKGRIRDPQDGHVYDVQVWFEAPGRMKLRGYLGLPLFGQTQNWSAFHGQIGPNCMMR